MEHWKKFFLLEWKKIMTISLGFILFSIIVLQSSIPSHSYQSILYDDVSSARKMENRAPEVEGGAVKNALSFGAQQEKRASDHMPLRASNPENDDQASNLDEDIKPQERMIIQTADIKFRVDKVSNAQDKVVELAKTFNGYISMSKQQGDYSSSFTIRVPTTNFLSMIAELKKIAVSVSFLQITGNDITDQYVDAAIRVRSQKAAQEQLMTLMKQAVQIQSILEVSRELQRYTEQIELNEGRMRYLKDRSQYSTINLELYEYKEYRPPDNHPWSPFNTAYQAFSQLQATFIVLIDAIIWLVILTIPFCFIIGIVCVVWYKVKTGQ